MSKTPPPALVDDLAQAMGTSGISKSPVARLCGEIDEKSGFS